MLFSVLVGGLALSILVVPLFTAQASVFSFISDIFTNREATASSNESNSNSQTIKLLEAPTTPKLAIGGGEISIVGGSALEFQAETSEIGQSDQINVYVVRQGDTLSQIAKMFNVSVNTILWANDIPNSALTPGENLVILPISGTKHIVKSGDTLQTIAKKFNADADEIKRFNNLSEEGTLAIGNEIIIPNGDATPIVASKPAAAAASKPSTTGYFAKPIAGSYKKSQGIHGYNGVDLAVPLNTKIIASAAGKVIVSRDSGYNGGYGNYIVISHANGTQTLYAHLTKTAVAQGTTVSQGQLIGYSGNTGKSTGPHLHFEVRGAKNPF